jgi:hypothetical protein
LIQNRRRPEPHHTPRPADAADDIRLVYPDETAVPIHYTTGTTGRTRWLLATVPVDTEFIPGMTIRTSRTFLAIVFDQTETRIA